MSTTASDVAFTPTVKAIQSAKGSREAYANMESQGGWETDITTELAHFIAEQDMFFLGTANTGALGQVQSGKLEMSNVDFAQQAALIGMAKQNYEANFAAFKAMDKLTESAIGLVR